MNALAPPRAAFPGAMIGGAERAFQEALERALRAPRRRIALALHLSRLPPPGPRPHHRRIARAVLQDAAQRHEGQVFTLRNGDMAMICRAPRAPDMMSDPAPDPAADAAPEAEAFPAALARLFRADVPEPQRLVSVWPLDGPTGGLLAWLAERAVETTPPPAEELPAGAPELDAIGAMLAAPDADGLARRQTAVLIPFGAGRLQPLFQEVTFSLAALEARLPVPARVEADPFLFQHLARRLDGRMLGLLARAVSEGGLAGGPPLHLNLTPDGVLSPGFDRFAEACAAARRAVGVEIAFVEACADPARFARARARVAAAGMTLALDGVGHLTLLLAAPEGLAPDLVKLEWSPRLEDAALTARLAEPLRRIGPGRLVLQRAETERALAWGLRQGIRRFQGRHVDAMLAAARLTACPHAADCTLGQCLERATALAAPARRFCRNLPLLDAAAPASGSLHLSRAALP